jgi:hypothetical protein
VPDVLTQFGLYHCSLCGGALNFEPFDFKTSSVAIGACGTGHDCGDPDCKLMASNCPMWNVRLKIPLNRMHVELA